MVSPVSSIGHAFVKHCVLLQTYMYVGNTSRSHQRLWINSKFLKTKIFPTELHRVSNWFHWKQLYKQTRIFLHFTPKPNSRFITEWQRC